MDGSRVDAAPAATPAGIRGPDADDADLVRAFQAGDEGAFDELVRRHRRDVYRLARRLLGTHEEADEASQDAFLKAWQALRRFRGESSFRTWMYRIVMNTALDRRSSLAHERRLRDDAAGESLETRERPGPRIVDALIEQEERDRVRAAVDLLPDRQRTTLLLKVHAGLKYVEIAEVLGCPVGTAKANFHHAVQGLRRRLAPGALGDPEDGSGESHDA